jgi:hypothetical protein
MLYILNNIGLEKTDFHKVFKILYFAEREHLKKFGNLITDNDYVAMQNGPVPSLAYDILNSFKDKGQLVNFKADFSRFFEVNDYFVSAKVKADLDELSESEIKCLDISIKNNKSKKFDILTKESHDYAWESTPLNEKMNIFGIAHSGGASKEMLSYIKDVLENKNLTFA